MGPLSRVRVPGASRCAGGSGRYVADELRGRRGRRHRPQRRMRPIADAGRHSEPRTATAGRCAIARAASSSCPSCRRRSRERFAASSCANSARGRGSTVSWTLLRHGLFSPRWAWWTRSLWCVNCWRIDSCSTASGSSSSRRRRSSPRKFLHIAGVRLPAAAARPRRRDQNDHLRSFNPAGWRIRHTLPDHEIRHADLRQSRLDEAHAVAAWLPTSSDEPPWST